MKSHIPNKEPKIIKCESDTNFDQCFDKEMFSEEIKFSSKKRKNKLVIGTSKNIYQDSNVFTWFASINLSHTNLHVLQPCCQS